GQGWLPPRKVMHGRLVDAWADAASGHAAAAPPSSAMSDRLFTAGPFRAFERKNSTPQLRQEAVALRDFNFRYDRSGVNLSHPTMSDQYPDYPASEPLRLIMVCRKRTRS